MSTRCHTQCLQSVNKLTEFRQPIQVQSHLEMPGFWFSYIQRTKKLAPQIDHKWSPTWSLRR